MNYLIFKLNHSNVCSKYCTLPRTVSIQVQPVSYKCQPGHKLFSDQCQTNVHNLISWMSHRDTSVAIKQALKRSMTTNGHDLNGSKCQYGHKCRYQQAINWSMPNQWAQSHRLWMSHRDTSLYQTSRHNLSSRVSTRTKLLLIP